MSVSENIPALLDDQNYFLVLFQKKIVKIEENAKSILFHQLFYIKRHVTPDFFHYVIEHRLVLELKSGLKKHCRVYTVSFSHHGRRLMAEALELVYHQGFAEGEVAVPRPIWYEDEVMAVFYLGIQGSSFLEHIKNDHFDLANIKKIAHGLSRLHAIKIPKAASFVRHEFTLDMIDRTRVIDRPHNSGSPLRARVLAQLKFLSELKQKTGDKEYLFSHGDFHPENIIINKFDSEQLAFIDFSEVCLAPRYYDIASFLQQLELMSHSYLTSKNYQVAEKVFLTAYFDNSKPTPEAQNQINLYKSWVALKNAIFAMILIEEDSRRYADYLLTVSEQLATKIKY